MKCQKPLPRLRPKKLQKTSNVSTFDEFEDAAEIAAEQREKLQSVYSTQCDLHQIKVLQNSVIQSDGDDVIDNQLRNTSGTEAATESTLFAGPSIEYNRCSIHNNKAIGVWVRAYELCVLIRRKGVVLQNCINKFKINVKQKEFDDLFKLDSTVDSTAAVTHNPPRILHLDVIPIEETLHLMERGDLLLFDDADGCLTTIEQIYECLDKRDLAESQQLKSELNNNNNQNISIESGLQPQKLSLEAYAVYGTLRRAGANLVRRQQLICKADELAGAIEMNEVFWRMFASRPMKTDKELKKEASDKRRNCPMEKQKWRQEKEMRDKMRSDQEERDGMEKDKMRNDKKEKAKEARAKWRKDKKEKAKEVKNKMGKDKKEKAKGVKNKMGKDKKEKDRKEKDKEEKDKEEKDKEEKDNEEKDNEEKDKEEKDKEEKDKEEKGQGGEETCWIDTSKNNSVDPKQNVPLNCEDQHEKKDIGNMERYSMWNLKQRPQKQNYERGFNSYLPKRQQQLDFNGDLSDDDNLSYECIAALLPENTPQIEVPLYVTTADSTVVGFLRDFGKLQPALKSQEFRDIKFRGKESSSKQPSRSRSHLAATSLSLLCLVDSSSFSSVIGPICLSLIGDDYKASKHQQDKDCNRYTHEQQNFASRSKP